MKERNVGYDLIRIVAIFMALLLALSATLASCGGSKDDPNETKDTSSESNRGSYSAKTSQVALQ